ncbi:MAG: N-acetylmuramoyl-L-alanine amidase, partial [Flavobacteriaceae bacterium]|nr:N-acetylmuramoyl-L-alanine amidase [Flavobacteriaceae bacterium]
MHKTTFLNIFFLITFLFGYLYLGYSQDKTIEFTQQYGSGDNYIGAKSSVLNVNYKNTSPFVLLSGFTKNMSFNGIAYYRLKSNNNWNDWIEFPEAHEGEDLDRVSLGAAFIEKAFQDIQFRVDKADNSKFVFRLFLPEFTKINSSKIASKKQILAGCTQPAFQGRDDWCPSGNCPKSTNPSVINPTHIVVHHSAGQTNSSDFAAVVRSYWDYHVNSRGWADIGYNWLIDPNGIVYEGRGDRIRGAHSPCMNAISTGICFIGNYEGSTQPSANGMQALKDMIAWDASDKNIDVLTSSYVSALNGNIEHISGHKDGYDQYPSSNCTSTACPGANLHNKLQTIRTDVSNYACYIASGNIPEKPISFSVIRSGSQKITIHISPVNNATKYVVYKSTDHINYQKITESTEVSITIDNLTNGTIYYFKIEAINDDGVSEKSTPLAAIPSSDASEFLIVDGIERRTFEGIKQYQYPMTQLGRTFSSATNDAIINGLIDLGDYKFVIWMLLDESTANDTFSKPEQTKVKNFIDNNGVFIVSGNEIGWDLVEKGDSTDKSFYENYFKAKYVADNPSPNNYKVVDNNNVTYNLDQSGSVLDNQYPDLIQTKNGSVKSFIYSGINSSTGIAGISYQTNNGGVEYLGFAIEGVTNADQRKDLLDYIFSKCSNLLAVEDTFIKQNIRLYPNPTSGRIYISNPN